MSAESLGSGTQGRGRVTAERIMSKLKRAIRNGTGATLTFDQIRELAEYGVLETLAVLETRELMASWAAAKGTSSDSD